MQDRYKYRQKLREKNRRKRRRNKRIAKTIFAICLSIFLIFTISFILDSDQKDKAINFTKHEVKKGNSNEVLAENNNIKADITSNSNLITQEGYTNELVNFLKTGENTIAYRKANVNSERLYEINNETVEAYGEENNWVKIRYNHNFVYVKEENLSEIEEDDLYIVEDGLLIVNEEYGIDDTYKNDFNPDANGALNSMIEAMEREGLKVVVGSKYRSIQEEKLLYEDGSYSHSYKPVPGHSEFNTGTTIEIHLPNEDPRVSNNLANSEEGKWLYENSYKYGYILRFPPSKKDLTGYSEEGIFKYVGVQKAQYIHDNELCLEEYLGK